jgi:hypothetical protein
MEALKTIPYIFLILAIAGIIAGASVLSVSKFGNSITQCDTAGTYYADSTGARLNASVQTGIHKYACLNSSTYIDADNTILKGNTTLEYRATLQTNEGMATVSEQFPTIGIIAVMVIIISLIAGVFVYMRMFA